MLKAEQVCKEKVLSNSQKYNFIQSKFQIIMWDFYHNKKYVIQNNSKYYYM